MTPQFYSSNPTLVDGWEWAVAQASAYVRSGDPVGNWFEAALPGRNAFCMRDVAHQSAGAQVLGLHAEVKNMLRRFAENIAASRDWCTYWEITGDNLPAAVDYQNDADFWYNLPANFDVLTCCWRQYQWTGDADYINDPVFLNFYDRTVNEYVRQWDADGDGIPEHLSEYGRRGLGSYEEGVSGIRAGGDLIAAQFAAYDAYAAIQALRGQDEVAERYKAQAATLRTHYENVWWDTSASNYFSIQQANGQFSGQINFGINLFALYFGIIQDAARARLVLDDLTKQFSQTNVESQSYFPEVAYARGDAQAAYNALLYLTNPVLPRREYPEVSYSVVGALVNGLIGLSGNAEARVISTLPRLTEATAWVSIEHVPVMGNEVSVEHRGNRTTILRNECGEAFQWDAHFEGEHAVLLVDGEHRQALQLTGSDGRPQASVRITVPAGAATTVAVPS